MGGGGGAVANLDPNTGVWGIQPAAKGGGVLGTPTYFLKK